MAETGMKNIQLKPEENAKLVGLLGRSGLSSTEAVRRMITWLDEAPDVVRAEVLGTLPESIRPEAKDWILKNMPDHAEIAYAAPSLGAQWLDRDLNDLPNTSISHAQATTQKGPATATAHNSAAQGRRVKGKK